jgi:hypothetical protein
MSTRAAFAVALILLVAPAAVRATVVQDLGLSRALELSSDVVTGEIFHQETFITERGLVYTESLLRVDQSLKGSFNPGETIVLRHLGGLVGDLGMHVEGMPRFENGERVLLFLEPGRNPATRRATGLYQGAYSLEQSDDGEWAVQKDPGTALAVGRAPADRLPARILLSSLLRAIRGEEALP